MDDEAEELQAQTQESGVIGGILTVPRETDQVARELNGLSWPYSAPVPVREGWEGETFSSIVHGVWFIEP
jgi:hypothetical protein